MKKATVFVMVLLFSVYFPSLALASDTETAKKDEGRVGTNKLDKKKKTDSTNKPGIDELIKKVDAILREGEPVTSELHDDQSDTEYHAEKEDDPDQGKEASEQTSSSTETSSESQKIGQAVGQDTVSKQKAKNNSVTDGGGRNTHSGGEGDTGSAAVQTTNDSHSTGFVMAEKEKGGRFLLFHEGVSKKPPRTKQFSQTGPNHPEKLLAELLGSKWSIQASGIEQAVRPQPDRAWDKVVGQWVHKRGWYGVIDWSSRKVKLHPRPDGIFRVYTGELLSEALLRWARRGGYSLVYEANFDFRMQVQSEFNGGVEESVASLADSIRTSDVPLNFTLYKGNRTLRVTEQ